MRFGAVGQRSETVRRANLSAIVRELHVGGPPSRSELVARTGLTRSAIRGLIGELSAADLVVRGAGRARRARPAGPPRSSASIRDGAVVLALEIAVDSLAAADRRARRRGARPDPRSIAPAATPRSRRSPPTSPSWRPTCARDAPPTSRWSASGWRSSASSGGATGSCRWRPTSAGGTCRSAAALADALDVDVPISVANDADLGALAELRRGAARRLPTRAVHLGRVRRRRRRDRRRPAADRRGGLRRRGRPPAGQPGRVAVPLRLGRLLGDRGRRGGAAAHGRPADRTAVAARSTRCCTRPRPARPRR